MWVFFAYFRRSAFTDSISPVWQNSRKYKYVMVVIGYNTFLPDMYSTSARFLPSRPRIASLSLSKATDPKNTSKARERHHKKALLFWNNSPKSVGGWKEEQKNIRTWLYPLLFLLNRPVSALAEEMECRKDMTIWDMVKNRQNDLLGCLWVTCHEVLIRLGLVPSLVTFVVCQGIPDGVGDAFLPLEKNLTVLSFAEFVYRIFNSFHIMPNTKLHELRYH